MKYNWIEIILIKLWINNILNIGNRNSKNLVNEQSSFLLSLACATFLNFIGIFLFVFLSFCEHTHYILCTISCFTYTPMYLYIRKLLMEYFIHSYSKKEKPINAYYFAGDWLCMVFFQKLFLSLSSSVQSTTT